MLSSLSAEQSLTTMKESALLLAPALFKITVSLLLLTMFSTLYLYAVTLLATLFSTVKAQASFPQQVLLLQTLLTVQSIAQSAKTLVGALLLKTMLLIPFYRAHLFTYAQIQMIIYLLSMKSIKTLKAHSFFSEKMNPKQKLRLLLP